MLPAHASQTGLPGDHASRARVTVVLRADPWWNSECDAALAAENERRGLMSIVGVESLLYAVDDMAVARRFWNDFGLTELRASARELVVETAEGTTVVVTSADRDDLPPVPGEETNT